MNGINPDPYAANRGPQEAPGWLKALAGLPKAAYDATIGKPYNTVQAPPASTRQRMDIAIANMIDPGQRGAAQGGNIGQRSLLGAPVKTVTPTGFVRQTPAERAAIAASAPTMGGLESAGINAAIARATQPQGGLGALEGETAARQRPRTTGSRGGFELADALSILGGVPNTGTGTVPVNTPVLPVDTPVIPEDTPVPPVDTNVPVVPAPVPVSDTIRSLYGEMSTRDFTDMIRNTMAEREANLRGLNQQSVDQLAANVLRRTGQIGDIKTALETELGVLDADRAGVQQNLVNAVAARAQELQAGTDASLAAAREALGPQVTDEFEKVAQIVGSQAASQATSSQDAMTRLAQIADMAAAERLAAPAELASEAELALGDEQFAYSQALQQNLSEALAGLDAEEAERVLGEAVRQENFNINRDQRMIEALVGNLVRQDTQQFQAGQAQLGRDFQADQAQLGRDFSAEQAQLGRNFSAGQSALSRLFQQSERIASQNFKAQQADIERAAKETERQIEAGVLAEQAALQEASDLENAIYYNVPVSVWQQMGASERLAVQNRRAEQEKQAGVGREAFPMGTIQNVRDKFPGVNPEFFMHAEALHGIDNKFATETPEEILKRREAYLNSLKVTEDYGAKGLNQAEVQLIDNIYSDLLLDKEIVNRQNRIDQQLEMSSVGRRR